MDIRSIHQCPPRLQHHGSTKVWWLQEVREMFAQTSGGFLESVKELEIVEGGSLRPHMQPNHEFYYVLSGYGTITVGEETGKICPGDLVYVPPNTVHSLKPISTYASIHCFCFGIGLSSHRFNQEAAASRTINGMDIRSIRNVAPVKDKEQSITVWWLYQPGELYEQTVGGHLELIDEFEVEGGSAVHPHKHPTYEFYYVTAGRALMTIESEMRKIGPGDLVLIPPDAVHSITPISVHASVHCFCFAIGIQGAAPYDYTYDQSFVDKGS